MAANRDGRLELFGTCNARLVHRWQIAGTATWSTWQDIGSASGFVVVGHEADGRLLVFAGSSYATQLKPGSSGWSGWTSLAGSYSPQVVASNADGRLEVFAADVERLGNAVVHAWQLTPNGKWSNWAYLAVNYRPGLLAVGRNADGRLELFGQDVVTLVHSWQAPRGGWSPWVSLGIPPPPYAGGIVQGWSGPSVASNADGRLEVFIGDQVFPSGGGWYAFGYPTYHLWQVAPNSGWSPWATLTKASYRDPLVTSNADGRLEVFGQPAADVTGNITNAGPVAHLWQLVPNGGWSSDTPLLSTPNPTGPVVVARNGSGRLEAFVPVGNAIWHASQIVPNGGWSAWQAMS